MRTFDIAEPAAVAGGAQTVSRMLFHAPAVALRCLTQISV